MDEFYFFWLSNWVRSCWLKSSSTLSSSQLSSQTLISSSFSLPSAHSVFDSNLKREKKINWIIILLYTWWHLHEAKNKMNTWIITYLQLGILQIHHLLPSNQDLDYSSPCLYQPFFSIRLNLFRLTKIESEIAQNFCWMLWWVCLVSMNKQKSM